MTDSLVDRIVRRQTWLDKVANPLQKAVGAVYGGLGRPGRALKNLMHGTAVLGHPLHPAVSDLPVGAWAAGVVADYVEGPATFDQPAFDVREREGRVDLKLATPPQ